MALFRPHLVPFFLSWQAENKKITKKLQNSAIFPRLKPFYMVESFCKAPESCCLFRGAFQGFVLTTETFACILLDG